MKTKEMQTEELETMELLSAKIEAQTPCARPAREKAATAPEKTGKTAPATGRLRTKSGK